MNLPKNLVAMGAKHNIMREIQAHGQKRAAIVGAENVLDFSIGNPSVVPPAAVNECIKKLIETQADTIHGYTAAPGDLDVRTKLATSMTKRFGMEYQARDFYLTPGAAGALSTAIRALTCPNDEFILLAPFFSEYTVFVESNGGKAVVVAPNWDTLEPDLALLEQAITPNTKAILVNSPNNPSGVIYSPATLTAMADILNKKSAEYGHAIYIISDEPYRELLFKGFTNPWIPAFYKDTIVCYSYSKSLSLPGERIGYVLAGATVSHHEELLCAISAAGRCLGYVNAPSLFQHVVAECDGMTADLSVYQTNRDLLYNGLTSLGFTCVEPGGTFYMFVKCPNGDSYEFCESAKAHDLLVVPTDDFACPGWFRIAFCTTTEQVERSLPLFAKLSVEYGLSK